MDVMNVKQDIFNVIPKDLVNDPNVALHLVFLYRALEDASRVNKNIVFGED